MSFTKSTFTIGGINTHVYNSSVLPSYVSTSGSPFVPIHVHYLIHPRGCDYKFTEDLAYSTLGQYYSKKDVTVPLICVTFDNRNHGERTVDTLRNEDWKRGNNTHAADLISSVEGIVADIKLVMDFLPTYLNLETHLPERTVDPKIKFLNIISGYSLGGHAVIRFAAKYPSLVDILNPVIGCHDLTSLLINRLRQTPLDDPSCDKKYFYHTYKELGLTLEQKESYPEALHKLLLAQDLDIYENFPMRHVKIFAAFGSDDKLVPSKFSKLWIDQYLSSNGASEVFVEEGVGHKVTKEMDERFVDWLVKNIE